MKYDIYCDFDIQKHKETYINYLEILILENGKIVYAIPGHQMKAEQLCCEKLNISKEELLKICPPTYYFDYLTWLLNISGAVAVWNDFYRCGENGLNKKQKAKLKLLKMNGLYKGVIGTNEIRTDNNV